MRMTIPVSRLARATSAFTRAAAASTLAAALGGCSAPKPTTFELTPEQYPAAFEAAKATLRDFRFPIERVDYQEGVITTALKPSSGLATPWDAEQSTFGQEWRDFANHQAREVRIRFAPASVAGRAEPTTPGTQASPAPASPSPSETAEPITAEVVVSVIRYERPGARPAVRAVQLSSFTEDPALTARGMYPMYQVVTERDDLLAGRIAARIQSAASPVVSTPAPEASP